MLKVRLTQELLSAFGDPDSYFCTVWARGVWLGSPARRLPRTPAVFDRRVRWRLTELGEDTHGERQRNYSSVAEHGVLGRPSSRRMRSWE